jgi:transglutaminase-like putative cysteine protease
MTWRIRIRHRSIYRYSSEVYSSYNEARITPLTTPDQLVLDANVTVRPAARPFRYWDYWGSVVHAFDLHDPHTELEVTGSSVVETSAPPPPTEGMDWETLASPSIQDQFAELLGPSRYVPIDDRITDVARSLARTGPPAQAASAAAGWVHGELTYVPGATGVHTSALEAWHGGRGVCQDFAHLTLAVVRAMGIPARYCSGYLHPDPDAEVGSVRPADSHAWVEVWTDDWRALDPTIGQPVGERHVLVARGRDYGDVTPLKGIYHGGRSTSLEVSVQLTRLG